MTKKSDLILAILIGIVLAWASIGFSNSGYYVSTYDDAAYMMRGLSADINPNNGGLTGLVYSVLSSIIGDVAVLQQTGQMTWYILSIGVTALACQVATGKLGITAVLTSLFIIFEGSLGWGVWPKPGISQYTSCLFFVAISAASLGKNNQYKYTFIVPGIFAIWICGWSRPESFYALGIESVILSLYLIYLGFKDKKFCWGSCVGIFLALFLLFKAVGFGVDSRSWVAFGQHYGLGLKDQGILFPGEDNWIDWEKILQRDFPGAHSITQALLISPSNFLAHISHNLSLWIGEVVSKCKISLALALVSTFIAYSATGKDGESSREKILLFSIPSISLLVPALFAQLIIYPRPHYYSTISLAFMILFLSNLSFIKIRFLTNFSYEKLRIVSRFKSIFESSGRLFPTALLILVVFIYRGGVVYPNSSLSEVDQIRLFMIRSNVDNFYVMPEDSFSVYLREVGVNVRGFDEALFKADYDRNNVCLIIRIPFRGERSQWVLQKYGNLNEDYPSIYCRGKLK